MNSPSSINQYSFKIPPTSFSSNNNRIKRANTLFIPATNIDHEKQDLRKFISNSQTNFQSDNLLTETVQHFNRHHPRITQQVTRHASLYKSNKTFSSILTSSLTEFKTTPMTDITKKDSPIHPSISITEMTSKDFDDEYQNFIEQGYTNRNIDQTLKYTSINGLSSEDDDYDVNENISEEEQVSKTDRIVSIDPKLKKKTKSSSHKKLKSSLKKTKQTNTIQIPPSTSTTSLSRPLPITDLTIPTKVSASSTKNEENNGTRNLIIVDTSKARSNLEVVRLCIKELGWKECSNGATLDSDIYWHSASFHEGNANFACNSGRVNKFPGMSDVLRKVHLTRSLNNMRLLFPNDYDFYPKTWFLPEQNQQLKDDVRYIHQQDKKHNRSLTTFIVKPSDGSQGEGIYLLRDPSHIINTNRPHVVQEYIDRPLLINGLKFDLRIYVLILNLYPLEIFLYDEGLVRFATIDYKAPSSENLHQTFMHLTNYSLNKRSASYKHTSDEQQTDGSKRKLSIVWEQLSHMFGNDKIERAKNLIIEMINKTILAILPELRVEYEFELPLGKQQNISCFQIIGFDVILNDQLKPILLEVNSNPSLRIDFDKENEIGKLVYQPSLIDEEIKKPLILETLKLALPKKKLHTIARHEQLQANDEIMAQRLEKVAQRRVEERSEKMKSARTTRFDMRLNPFFSRPLESIAKEFTRQHQEQQQYDQQKIHSASPTHAIILGRSTTDLIRSIPTTHSLINNNNKIEPAKSAKKVIIKLKKSHKSTVDDDESGVQTSSITESDQSNLITTNIKRPLTKSGFNHHTTTNNAAMIGSIKSLKLIFPAVHKSKYQHLFLVDKIAYIYIQLVVMVGYKTMASGQFRSFANVCGIINETITASSIDILYYQILRKWQQFVLRTTSTGLPFAAFVEAFFLLSQRKFPNARSLLDSVDHLVNICIRHLNNVLQAPGSPLIYQSNQYLLQRSAKNNSTMASSSMNIRPNIAALRSPTTSLVHRSFNVASSTPAPKSHHHHHHHQMISSATTVSTNSDDKTKQNTMRQSTKSVFPLFFDVL